MGLSPSQQDVGCTEKTYGRRPPTCHGQISSGSGFTFGNPGCRQAKKVDKEFENGVMWEEVLVEEISHGTQEFLARFKQEANWYRKTKSVATIYCPRSGNMAVIMLPLGLRGKRVKIEVSWLPEGKREIARVYRIDEVESQGGKPRKRSH